MPKDICRLMKKNDFHLHRKKKHLVWKHITGALIVTAKTTSDHRSMKNLMKLINREIGYCYA